MRIEIRNLVITSFLALLLSASTSFGIDWSLPLHVDSKQIGTLAEFKEAYNWGKTTWTEVDEYVTLKLKHRVSLRIDFEFYDDHYKIEKIIIDGRPYKFKPELAATMIAATVRHFSQKPTLAMPLVVGGME